MELKNDDTYKTAVRIFYEEFGMDAPRNKAVNAIQRAIILEREKARTANMTDHTEMQIPDDVMEAANRCTAEFRWNNDSHWNIFVARAILAERERCARIASGCSCDAQFLIRDWAPMTEDKSAEIKAGAQSMFDYIRHVDK